MQNTNSPKKEKTRLHHQHIHLGEEVPGLRCKDTI